MQQCKLDNVKESVYNFNNSNNKMKRERESSYFILKGRGILENEWSMVIIHSTLVTAALRQLAPTRELHYNAPIGTS